MTRSDMSVDNGIGVQRSLVSIGQYQMIRVLGKGNFARVEEAIHTVLKTKVAVKIIDTGHGKDYVLKNLTREAKLLSMLKHPNIVRLYETIQYGPVYYLVMELATGGDLCTHIRQQPGGMLDETTAKFYGRQLVAALKHMHSRGIVHRDLKMENIMLQDARKEQIKIVDFGLSNIYNCNDPLKTHCGSPEYAAPELFVVGKKYGPEVDLWSLGVVLYGMMTGRLPFLSPSDDQTSSQERRRRLMAQINRGLTALQVKDISRMSSECKNLISRLLTPVPHKRITIQELCHHPWIARKTRNIPKVVSESELNVAEHNAIIVSISKITHLDRNTIEMEIVRRKYGEIGGMYNIKSHKASQATTSHTNQSGSFALLRNIPQNLKQSYSATPVRNVGTNETVTKSAGRFPHFDVQQYTTQEKPVKKSAGNATRYKDIWKCWDSKSILFAEVKNSIKLHKAYNPTCTFYVDESSSSTNTQELPQKCSKKNDYQTENSVLTCKLANKSNPSSTEKKQTSRSNNRHSSIRILPSSLKTTSSRPYCPYPESNVLHRNPIKRWSEMREKRETIRQQRRSTHSIAQTDQNVTTSTSSASKTSRPRTSESGTPFARNYNFILGKVELSKERVMPSGSMLVKKLPRYETITSRQSFHPPVVNKVVSKVGDKVR